jgi:uncharacterized membrane protein
MTHYEWSPPFSLSVYVALGLGMAALLLLIWWLTRSPNARKWPLLLLRAAVLIVLVVILINAVQVSEARLPPRASEIIYLVDCSRSMALDRPESRLDGVKRVISQSEVPAATGNRPSVSVYRFGDRLLASPGVAELFPTDDRTELLAALEQLPSRFRDGAPAGVVVFSDGRTTEQAGFDEVAASYRKLGVPLHVFPVGDARVSGDVAIEDVVVPREAPTGARLPVRVVVRSHGYKGRRTEVRIRSQSDPDRKPLAILPITLDDTPKSYELVIELDKATAQLVAEVVPLENEAILENNQVAFRIAPRKSKLRVLYMEGTLNNEYHWLHDALVEDPDIECVSLEVNNQYAVQPTLHRVKDPRKGYPTTREELFGFDVVICSDINRTAFTQDQLDWTVELVRKRGGGFAMIGGNTSFGAGNWDKTVWDALVPVDMSGQAESPGRGTCWGVNFNVKVPADAERHPIWRIVDDPEKNRQVLDKMPAFTGTNLVERLKPAATALGYSDRKLPKVGVMPVFSCETYGQGRTFAMSTDTTADWGVYFEKDWGENGDNRYFRKFWRNVVRWLAENSNGANRRLRVETDKVIYRPGQPIKVNARAFDDKLEEIANYRLVARLRPAAGATPPPLLQETALLPQGGGKKYEGELTAPTVSQVTPAASNLAPGATARAALEVTAYDKDVVVTQVMLDIQILDDPAEFADPRPDPQRLEELAHASGGRVLHSAQELSQVLGDTPTAPGEVVVRKAPLWDHPAVWGLLLALLSVDWVLRRWWGLA